MLIPSVLFSDIVLILYYREKDSYNPSVILTRDRNVLLNEILLRFWYDLTADCLLWDFMKVKMNRLFVHLNDPILWRYRGKVIRIVCRENVINGSNMISRNTETVEILHRQHSAGLNYVIIFNALYDRDINCRCKL